MPQTGSVCDSPLRAGLLGLALGHVPARWPCPWPCPWLIAMLRWSSSCCAAFRRCCRSVNTHSGRLAPDCSRANLQYDAQSVSLNSIKNSRGATPGQPLLTKLTSAREGCDSSCITCCHPWPAQKEGTNDASPAVSALAIK